MSPKCRCVPEVDQWALGTQTGWTLHPPLCPGPCRSARERAEETASAKAPRQAKAWPGSELAGESGGWRAGVTGSLGAAGVGPSMPGKELDLYPAGGEGDPRFPHKGSCCHAEWVGRRVGPSSRLRSQRSQDPSQATSNSCLVQMACSS